MIITSWSSIPNNLKNDDVYNYYEILSKRKFSLLIKRVFDIIISLIMIILMLPLILVISIVIKLDSKCNVFFMQRRVTQYGRVFRIFKFRTMVNNAESLGTQVTVSNDSRVTKVGKVLRKYRLDEVPQLFNIFLGDMSFVGTRPEVEKYVEKYTNEMKATLLMPAGVTSLASICFKDEEKLLKDGKDTDTTYVEQVLPQKMKYNLEYIKDFNFFNDIVIMFKTVIAVLK